MVHPAYLGSEQLLLTAVLFAAEPAWAEAGEFPSVMAVIPTARANPIADRNVRCIQAFLC